MRNARIPSRNCLAIPRRWLAKNHPGSSAAAYELWVAANTTWSTRLSHSAGEPLQAPGGASTAGAGSGDGSTMATAATSRSADVSPEAGSPPALGRPRHVAVDEPRDADDRERRSRGERDTAERGSRGQEERQAQPGQSRRPGPPRDRARRVRGPLDELPTTGDEPPER